MGIDRLEWTLTNKKGCEPCTTRWLPRCAPVSLCTPGLLQLKISQTGFLPGAQCGSLTIFQNTQLLSSLLCFLCCELHPKRILQDSWHHSWSFVLQCSCLARNRVYFCVRIYSQIPEIHLDETDVGHSARHCARRGLGLYPNCSWGWSPFFWNHLDPLRSTRRLQGRGWVWIPGR